MVKILKSIRVVELGTYITGPAAAMHLADLGADVIKVERPETGDPFRAFKGGLYSPHYQTYNRNKRSIALDTAEPDDRAVFHDLIGTAPTCSSRISGPASPRSSGPGRTSCAAQPAARSIARSRASAHRARRATGRPSIPSPRRRAAICGC